MTHNRPNSKAPTSLTSWLLVWLLASALMTPMMTPATADEPTAKDKTTGQGSRTLAGSQPCGG